MMASSPPTAHRSHRHSAALSRVGSSKNHSALAKIIAIISMTPPPTSPPCPQPDSPRLGGGDPEAALGRTTKRPTAGETGGLVVDLRLRLGPSPQIDGGSVDGDDGGPKEQSGIVDVASAMEESGRSVRRATEEAMDAPAAALGERSFSPVASVAGGSDVVAAAKSSEGECDPEEENAEENRGATAKEAEEKAFAEQKATKQRGAAQAGTTTTSGDRGSLDLLLEAVRQVSGGLFDDDGPVAEKPEPAAAAPTEEGDSTLRKRRSADGNSGRKKRREEEWCIPLGLYEEETAPIVRSKRGRNQALSSRYRDSILDPWRKPAALSRHSRATRP